MYLSTVSQISNLKTNPYVDTACIEECEGNIQEIMENKDTME